MFKSYFVRRDFHVIAHSQFRNRDMPQADTSMACVEAWYAHEIVDRAPVRFVEPEQSADQ